eukprot:11211373-Lingulodinium_polyedra.AAC.1
MSIFRASSDMLMTAVKLEPVRRAILQLIESLAADFLHPLHLRVLREPAREGQNISNVLQP